MGTANRERSLLQIPPRGAERARDIFSTRLDTGGTCAPRHRRSGEPSSPTHRRAKRDLFNRVSYVRLAKQLTRCDPTPESSKRARRQKEKKGVGLRSCRSTWPRAGGATLLSVAGRDEDVWLLSSCPRLECSVSACLRGGLNENR